MDEPLKVETDNIKKALDLEANLSIPQALKAANEVMGLSKNAGLPLPSQADLLLAANESLRVKVNRWRHTRRPSHAPALMVLRTVLTSSPTQVDGIKKALDISASLSMPAALKVANELMGVSKNGAAAGGMSLPSQADALLAAIGV